jgi:phosphonate transport system permease protein
VAIAVLAWLGRPAAWLALLPFWVAAVVDARALLAGRRPNTAALVLLAALPFYVAAWTATEFAPQKLVANFERVQPLFRAFLRPDLVTRQRHDLRAVLPIQTPCSGETLERSTAAGEGGWQVVARPGCVPLGGTLVVAGSGFPADTATQLTWENPSGDETVLARLRTAADGRLGTQVVVPVESVPEIYRERVLRQRLIVTVEGRAGALQPSETVRLILQNIGVTVALGLMATLLGALIAAPLSVLGARNLMGGSRLSRAVYGVVRGLLNILRSIEPLILAVVFVVWVSQGPFAGMLALTIHSVAALGKLYSEQIEDIDVGPVEAVRATGATWLQMVTYAVVPQIVPPFTSFTVYRWDINVRMSTIIGFVGGGGIGSLLQQWIAHHDWSAAATAMLAIAGMVMALDFLSATVRERISAGQPLVRRALRPVLAVAILLFIAWAWRVSEIEPQRLVHGAPKIRSIAGELLRPQLVSRGVFTQTTTTALLVPCSLPESAFPAATEPEGRRLALAADCADAGQRIGLTGEDFPPGARGVLYWQLPDGRRLPAGPVRVDATGAVTATVEVRPLLAAQGQATGRATGLALELRQQTGGLRPSEALRTTASELIRTILMALMATTLGALLAFPLALLGARNLMPRNAVGSSVYFASRTLMNLLRAIEPIILGAVFAAWVGYGSPFAGVMALVVVTVASLGKLFSEAIENIDHGPIEALQACGANRAQMIVYGVVPQIVSPFLSFGIYHWDINVRVSTVIGFVGGGGIGFALSQWMNTLRWGWAAVAILGIIVTVSLMDYVSAQVRDELV